MTNASINKIRDRVSAVTAALVAMLAGFGVISWDTSQTALVVAATASLVMLVGSLCAHLRQGSPKEWPAVAMSLVAFVASGLAALNSIGVLHLTGEQIELVIGLLTALLGLGGIPIINRSAVREVNELTFPGGADDPANGSV